MEVRERRRKNAKGKWTVTYQMDYVDPETGTRKRPTLDGVRNLRDAEAVAKQRWAEINLAHELGEDAPQTEGEKGVTLSQLLALDLARPGIAAHTRRMETYRHETIKRVLTPDLPAVKLRTVTLVRYQSTRAAEVSHGSVNDELAILRAALTRAKKHGLLTKLPCEFPDKLPETEPRRRFLQPAQVEALLSHLQPAQRDIAEFLYRMGGMRPGEVWRLTWADIDFSQGTITITGTKRGTSSRIRSRTLPLSEHATAILQRVLTARKGKSSQLVFGLAPEERNPKRNTRGKRHGYNGGVLMFNQWHFNAHLKNAAKLAGIPHPETVTAYTLRHSAATNATGADITDVAYMLGHSDPRMTMQVYRHARMDRVQAGLDSLQGHHKGTKSAAKKRAA